MKTPVSIVILTKNEQADLPRCLEALTWTDDIHMLDSGSTDDTLRIAESKGVKCYHRPFDSFGKQRNWALENCALRYRWILFLDADEVAPVEFANEVARVAALPESNVAGYYCCWKMMLNDQWLRHADSFPKWQLRLVRSGAVKFIDFGHGQKEGEVTGILGYVKTPYLHYAFSKGWSFWIEKHNRYSSLEADERLASKVSLKNIWGVHSSQRNTRIKILVSRVPGWPLLRFIHAYFFTLGFLDGRAGLRYAILMAYYEFMIRLKISEKKRAQRGNEANKINT